MRRARLSPRQVCYKCERADGPASRQDSISIVGRSAVGAHSDTGMMTDPDDTNLRIRTVERDDLGAVVAIDHQNTGLAKPAYWRDVFERYGGSTRPRFFLVAEEDGTVLGFTIGEIRAWEFGSEPCGWVFAISVRREARLHYVGSHLLKGLEERFRKEGVTKIRTMLNRNDNLVMSFFRSHGMMAGPFIQLEKELDDGTIAEEPPRRNARARLVTVKPRRA